MLMNDPHQREQAACGLGHSFLRLEDEALLTGQAQFLDDIPMEGVLHACFVRSPHAHARMRAARAAPHRNRMSSVAIPSARSPTGPWSRGPNGVGIQA